MYSPKSASNSELPPVLHRICVIVLLSVALHGQSSHEYHFQQGNEAYRAGEYATAIEQYRQIEAAGYASSILYYNLGNTYYKLNEIGESILYYEKARKLDPDDEEIARNLEIANLKVVDRIELPPQFFLFQWWDAFMEMLTLHELTVLFLALYTLLMSGLISLLFISHTRVRSTLRSGLIATGILTLVAAWLLVTAIRSEETEREAVLLVSSATAYSGPDQNSTDVFILHEGSKFEMTEARGEWARIRLADGKTGWLHSSVLAEI